MTVKYIIRCAYRGAVVGAGLTTALFVLSSGQGAGVCKNNRYYERGWTSEYDQECLDKRKKALLLIYAFFTAISSGIGFVYGVLRTIDCWLSDTTACPRLRP